MTQSQSQFQRPLLRIGSIAFLVGVVITIVSTAIHPSTKDPSNHLLVFTKYASDASWIVVHIGQFVGVIIVFAGGFVALPLACAIRVKHGFYTSVDWSLAIMTASVFAVLQAVDGIALKKAVDSWAAASPEEKAITFRVTEGIRFIEYGTNSIFRILQGTVAVIFGIAAAKSKLLSKWIC